MSLGERNAIRDTFEEKYSDQFGDGLIQALDWAEIEKMNERSNGELEEDLLDLESWRNEVSHCSSLGEAVSQILAWYA